MQSAEEHLDLLQGLYGTAVHFKKTTAEIWRTLALGLRIFTDNYRIMNNPYYSPDDLKKFGSIVEFQKSLGDKFFSYYGEVFSEGALTAREKSLIALAVSHAVQCPYCIDAYSNDAFEKGYNEAQMMEAVHVAAAIRGGASLVHGVQMMNKVKEIAM